MSAPSEGSDRDCRITIWLSVETKKCTAEEISSRLSIGFDRSGRVGDRYGKKGKTRETNEWCLKERCEVPFAQHYEEISAAVRRILERVEPAAAEFRELAGESFAQLTIGIIAPETPGINIPSDLLQRIATLGVDLEIDIVGTES